VPAHAGVVRVRGVEYPGHHQPPVDAELWQAVHDRLSAQGCAGEKQRLYHDRSDRDLGLDRGAGPRGGPNGEPPAQGLDSVLEPEEAGPAGECGGAAAVITHADA